MLIKLTGLTLLLVFIFGAFIICCNQIFLPFLVAYKENYYASDVLTVPAVAIPWSFHLILAVGCLVGICYCIRQILRVI
jgi:hypothetical protein